jgi:hypothetical protein
MLRSRQRVGTSIDRTHRRSTVAEEADPTDAVPEESDEPEVAAADDAAAEESPPAAPVLTREDLAPPDRNLERIGLIVLLVAAILMAGFVLGRVSAPGTEEGATASTAPAVVYPAGDQDRSGYWTFAGIEAVVTDSFDRDDGPLGMTDTEQEWNPVTGTWEIEDGHAAAPDQRSQASIAVVPGGSADRLTEATMTVVEPGAGIVFRYRDPQNLWTMTADPENGGWLISKVIDGQRSRVAEIPGRTADATAIGVAQRGDELQVLIDGQEVRRVTGSELAGQPRSGLIAPADSDGSARFDRFYVGDIAITG